MCRATNGRWLKLKGFIQVTTDLYGPLQLEAQRFLQQSVQRLHKLEIETAASQVSPEAEDSVHGGEKPQTNIVHAANIPVSKPKLSVVLPKGGQGGENVTTRTRSGKMIKKPERQDL